MSGDATSRRLLMLTCLASGPRGGLRRLSGGPKKASVNHDGAEREELKLMKS